MPYAVEKRGPDWVVINTDTQEVKAKHDSEEEANRQVKLLHMLEKKED